MIPVIWLIFTALFLVLGIFHWIASRKVIPHFQVSVRPYMQPSSGIQVIAKIGGADIDKPLEDFVSEFNSYLDDYNQSQRRQNRLQAFGYFLASATALYSLFLFLC